jgi:hypothetical protein
LLTFSCKRADEIATQDIFHTSNIKENIKRCVSWQFATNSFGILKVGQFATMVSGYHFLFLKESGPIKNDVIH